MCLFHGCCQIPLTAVFLFCFICWQFQLKKTQNQRPFHLVEPVYTRRHFWQLQLRSYTNITPIISFVVNAEKKYDDKMIISAGINVERLGRHLQEPDLADWRNYFSFYILHFSFFFPKFKWHSGHETHSTHSSQRAWLVQVRKRPNYIQKEVNNFLSLKI